jgi:hypothetical protein
MITTMCLILDRAWMRSSASEVAPAAVGEEVGPGVLVVGALVARIVGVAGTPVAVGREQLRSKVKRSIKAVRGFFVVISTFQET